MSIHPSVADDVSSLIYTWKTPSLSSSERLILCRGYCREINVKKIITPECLIQLLNKYFRPNDANALYRIKHASRHQKFSSPVFEMYQFKWMICFYPNGKPDGKKGNVYLELHQLTALTQDSDELIKVSFKLSILEARHVQIPRCVWHCDYEDIISDGGWENGMLKLDDLKRYKTITIRLELQLVTVTDERGNDITEEILYQTERKYKKKIQRKLVESKLNAMRNDKGIEQVKHWLTYQVKLPQYFPEFIECGFEDMFTMKLVTENKLHEIGIKKIGHQLKILQHIQMLLDESNKNNNKCCGNKRGLDDVSDNVENEQPFKKQKR
eukprot:6703_1